MKDSDVVDRDEDGGRCKERLPAVMSVVSD